MQSDANILHIPDTVLLSAVPTNADGGTFVAATEQVCGIPLLSLQVRQLQRLGIVRFLIEAEQMSGALLAAADELTEQGVDLEIIRSPQELVSAVTETKRLLVLAPGTQFKSKLLATVVNENDPVLATVDGRDENDDFERIDLNTRWSGIAVLDTSALQDIAALPEGWSLTSALLRGALQANVRQLPVDQKYLNLNALQVIGDSQSLDKLTAKKLQNAGDAQPGSVESKVYAPIAKWAIKRLTFDHNWIGIGSSILSVAALAASAVAFPKLGAGLGIAAVFFLTSQSCLTHITNARHNKVFAVISWALLFIAFLLISYGEGRQFAVFSAIMISALLAYSSNQMLGPKSMRLFPSPALASWVLFLAALGSQFGIVLQVFAIIQLATLLYVQFANQKNATQLNRP